MWATLGETPRADLALYARLDAVGQAVADLERRLAGDPARQKLSEPDTLSISGRVGAIRWTIPAAGQDSSPVRNGLRGLAFDLATNC